MWTYRRSSGRRTREVRPRSERDALGKALVVMTIHLLVDGRLASYSELTLTGGEGTQTPAQLLVPVGDGRHTAGVEVQARYPYSQSGEVPIYPVSVIASALPSA